METLTNVKLRVGLSTRLVINFLSKEQVAAMGLDGGMSASIERRGADGGYEVIIHPNGAAHVYEVSGSPNLTFRWRVSMNRETVSGSGWRNHLTFTATEVAFSRQQDGTWTGKLPDVLEPPKHKNAPKRKVTETAKASPSPTDEIRDFGTVVVGADRGAALSEERRLRIAHFTPSRVSYDPPEPRRGYWEALRPIDLAQAIRAVNDAKRRYGDDLTLGIAEDGTLEALVRYT